MSHLDELEIGARPRRPGRTAAISELFAAHHRRLVGLAATLVDDRQTAEDVVQDSFASLYRRWRDLRDPDAAVAYLNRAVLNAGRDRLRHGRRALAGLRRLGPVAEETASAEQTAVGHAESERLWQAITELPRRQRQVIVLRYYQELSEIQIARTLGISPGSVKQHASRALASLARSLEEAP